MAQTFGQRRVRRCVAWCKVIQNEKVTIDVVVFQADHSQGQIVEPDACLSSLHQGRKIRQEQDGCILPPVVRVRLCARSGNDRYRDQPDEHVVCSRSRYLNHPTAETTTVTSAIIAMAGLIVRVMSVVYVFTFPTEATLAFSGSFSFHDCGVSIGLICNHVPAPRQAGEDGGFGSAL
jgi:hypothetical protein